MLKGPFWIISDSFCEECNMISFPVPFDDKNTPSHKEVWKDVCGNNKSKAWNYYPRGRVEIRRNKAIVFANPMCFKYSGFEIELRRNFDLKEINIVFKFDNSHHYQNLISEYFMEDYDYE